MAATNEGSRSKCLANKPLVFVSPCDLRKVQGDADTGDLFAKHLEREPSLVAATQWIANEKFEHEEFHPQVQRALERAAKPLQRYRCAACGFEASQHFWQCPGCQAWDSYPARRVEEL